MDWVLFIQIEVIIITIGAVVHSWVVARSRKTVVEETARVMKAYAPPKPPPVRESGR